MLEVLHAIGLAIAAAAFAYVGYVVFFQSRTVETFDDDEDWT